jgi:hypothetical protein
MHELLSQGEQKMNRMKFLANSRKNLAENQIKICETELLCQKEENKDYLEKKKQTAEQTNEAVNKLYVVCLENQKEKQVFFIYKLFILSICLFVYLFIL